MRIFEIADAEAQLALWKLVNDSVWTAIQTQQHEQAKQKAAAQQQKKAKRSTKRISKRSMSVPLSLVPNFCLSLTALSLRVRRLCCQSHLFLL